MPDTIIKFNNFSFRYKRNKGYQLEDINLEIKKNKFILLVGETGSGKTTLIKSMNGLIPQFYAGFYKGNVIVNGKDTIETPISELSTEIGIVFQNPENQLISLDVEHEIAFGLENIGVSKEIMEKRIKECIKVTEIEHLVDKAPFELSGGEQQRVAIASILALEPKVLILDEPTALLDPYMAQKIINLLKKIQLDQKITIIISEHRLDLIMPVADEIILINEGKIIEHDLKENVINGNNFDKIRINKPLIYSITRQLKEKNLYKDKIPASIPEAMEFFEKWV
jgi:energy-coupling factor transporter ATP-binding protein EcfA2